MNLDISQSQACIHPLFELQRQLLGKVLKLSTRAILYMARITRVAYTCAASCFYCCIAGCLFVEFALHRALNIQAPMFGFVGVASVATFDF